MTDTREIQINVPLLPRVEGEGGLEIILREGRIDALRLRIFEPPRLFEKLLEGRDYAEVPDVVARICGICPVAYQMSAVHALERLFGAAPTPWVRAMRRALYCGEWIESHALHIHLLAAPDFMGFPNAIAMAQKFPDLVHRGLRLQALGNRLIKLFGGRSVHPVGACVGGFHRAPAEREVSDLVRDLRAALPEAEALVRWTAALEFPSHEQTFTCVSLRHAHEYPMNEGRLASSEGLDIGIEEFEGRVTERQVPYSTALHAALAGKPYLVGPLARINLNRDRLPEAVQRLLEELPVQFPSRNMFHSIVARAIEIYYSIREAVRVLEDYAVPENPSVPVTPREGSACAATEAPRGTLYHRYHVDVSGLVRAARIVPPTSQNQARMEEDLRDSLTAYGLDRSEQELRNRSEAVIRNYDPCISCSTHFLTLCVKRG
jgi:sulfhydrogenase subunit alpha